MREIFSLAYKAPYDFKTLLSYYRAHQILGVEEISDESYARVFRTAKGVAWIQVSNLEDESKLRIEYVGPKASMKEASSRIEQMFGLNVDPVEIERGFSKNKYFSKLWKKYPGIRIPQSWTPFEALLATVLGQLVSMEQAGRLIFQLLKACGEKIKHPVTGEDAYLFPTPEQVAASTLDDVRTTGNRRKTLHAVANAVLDGTISLDLNQDATQFKVKVLDLPGIGPWSAEYMTLRALGDPDSFPGTDLILKRALEAHTEMKLDSIKPYRSYGALYIWKEHAKALSKKSASKKS